MGIFLVGNEAELCAKSDPASTACVECKPGTYQMYSFESCYAYSYQCESHTVCAEGMISEFVL